MTVLYHSQIEKNDFHCACVQIYKSSIDGHDWVYCVQGPKQEQTIYIRTELAFFLSRASF